MSPILIFASGFAIGVLSGTIVWFVITGLLSDRNDEQL